MPVHLVSLLLLALPACDSPSGVPATPGSPAREPVQLDAWTDGPKGPRVSMVGDLRQRDGGRMHMTLRYDDLDDSMWSFRALGVSPELAYEDVRFSTPEGKTIGHDRDGRVFDLDGRAQSSLVVEYDVVPGGDGRHGHQGIVQDDFALFDGRVFLVPDGAGGLRGARVRFEAPEGWITGSALREQDGWLLFDQYGPERVLTAVSGTCFGVGPFEGQTRTLGRSEVRVFTFGGWDEATRKELARSSFALFDWFHGTLGFDPDFPLALVWSPKHQDGRVYGGSSANGTCMEQPKPNLRAWQLAAHRLGHSMNKYAPSGLHLRDEADDWFKEGWPSYIEMVATEGAGLTPKSNRWNDLYRVYLDTRRDKVEQDLSMLDEHAAPASATEYLHYFKAPIIVMLLDDWIQRRHGKDLTTFMAAMWQEHGRFQKPFALREELEAWVGAPLDDFWALHVNQRGWAYPVWEEYLTPAIQEAATAPGAGTAGGRPFTGDYLHHLAASGDFERFADVVAFIESEEPRRAQLAAAGVSLLPPALEPFRAGFPPEARYNLARAEAAYPLPTSPPPPPPEGALVLGTTDPDAIAFARLLADEVAYEQAILQTGIEKLVLQRKNPKKAEGEDEGEDDETYLKEPALVFGTKDEVRIQTSWAWQTGQVKVKARRGDDVADDRERTISPTWTRSWSLFDQGKLPPGEGIVTFEVQTESGPTVLRSYWRRDR